jgi:hypothetical protein
MPGSLKLVPKNRDELGDISNQLSVTNAHLSLYRLLIIVKVDALAVDPDPVDYELARFLFV